MLTNYNKYITNIKLMLIKYNITCDSTVIISDFQ